MPKIKLLYAFESQDFTYKEQLEILIEQMNSDPLLVEEIKHDLETLKHPVPWRASWILSHFWERQPEKGKLELHWIIDVYLSVSQEGILRQFGKVISLYDFTDYRESELINYVFELLANPATAIAVRVHAMEIAFKAGIKYPELHSELFQCFEFISEEEHSAALNARMRAITKQVKRLQLP